MHLFSKENIWSNPQAVSCIHPDKNNNSVVRIISKEEEREDPRRDSSIYLRVQNTVVFPHSYKNYTKSNIPTSFPVIPCYFTYRINSSTRILQEILQLQGSSRADQYKASSSNCSPCIQAFYTAESSHKAPTAFQGHTAQAGFQ